MIFFDLPTLREPLKPLTLTRPIAKLRVGIDTLEDKWKRRLANTTEKINFSYLTETYLQPKYPFAKDKGLLLNAAICPDAALADAVAHLAPQTVLQYEDLFIAAHLSGEALLQCASFLAQEPYQHITDFLAKLTQSYAVQPYEQPVTVIRHTWDIFELNADQIATDYQVITHQRTSQPISDPFTHVYHPENVFVEEGVSIKAAIINAEAGPVYIGKNATIHENAVIQGPFAMLEGAHVNVGAKIREATTIGPRSKVGGEVKNTVFWGNSNKGHEGFVGNSVVGEWCNFGADTNVSNLKNNYQPVKLYDYATQELIDTGATFCGLIMGDHSKCGINTMFNTGTVVGVFANIFGSGYTPKFIPSFTWGDQRGGYRIDKALEVYERVLARRGLSPSPAEVGILRYLYEQTTSASNAAGVV